MAKQIRIILLGANGCGKTTLGRELGRVLNIAHFDVEKYYFNESEIPYALERSKEERNEMLLSDMRKNNSFVLSGDISGWGEEFLTMFDLVIYLEAPIDVRMERIESREIKRWGGRVCKGGDMYESQMEFRQFVATRDVSDIEKAALKFNCPIVYLDSTKLIDELTSYIVRKTQVYSFFGKIVTVTVDRPIGTAHPKHFDIIYPINYGYIKGEIALDGEELDAYIIGITEPLTSFTGKVIAIIHRENDIEDKLVVAPEGCEYNQAEIATAVHFQEQFYTSTIDCFWRKSAGMIVFRTDANAVRYLLLFQAKSQTWSFPKGHMDIFETEQQTAIREVKEEIGQDLIPLPDFRAILSYELKSDATKTVVLFLSEASTEVKIRKNEIEKYCWATAEEAITLLKHDSYKKILEQAEQKITEYITNAESVNQRTYFCGHDCS